MLISQRTYTPSEYAAIPRGVAPTKVEKFGWSIKDQPGRFMEINKHFLNVDHSYQRNEVIVPKVRQIQSQWSWLGCGAILVVMRTDGTFWVYDGQHRVTAALNRSDITDLPCLVFECSDVKEEAVAFLKVNTERKPVTSFHKFNARVCSGDDAAGLVNDVFVRLGITLTKTATRSREIKCIDMCLRYAAADAERFERVMSAALVLCVDSPITKVIANALWWVDKQHELLSDNRFMTRLRDMTASEVTASIAKFALAEEKRGERVCGMALLRMANKGLRKKFGDSEEE